jgi:protein-S-isoprenylcysteine O-methyltransferase Ste14
MDTDIEPRATGLPAPAAPLASRWATLLYGSFAYACFLGTFLYAVAFVKNLVPKSIDQGGADAPLGEALLVNGALLGAFAVQHSVMARAWFKRWWTRFVPTAVERSTFVLVTCFLLILTYLQWRPMTATVWAVRDPVLSLALDLAGWFGWGLVLVATFLIDHFDLFGLKQVIRFFRGGTHEDPAFKVVGLYRYTRHPLYLGFMIAFWATPVMTAGHLLFAVLTTGFMLFAIRLEERDLMRAHPAYADYRRRVPMLLGIYYREARR